MIGWLFDTSMGPPGPAGRFSPALTVLFHGSNLVAALAQLAFLAIIVRNWKYRRDGVTPWLFWSVILFLPLTAASRLGRVAEIFGPPYRLIVILDCLVAIGTVYSDLYLPGFVKNVLLLPSRKEHHDIRDKLQASLLREKILQLDTAADRDAARKDLQRALDIIKTEMWMTDRIAVLDALNSAASRLKTEATEYGRG